MHRREVLWSDVLRRLQREDKLVPTSADGRRTKTADRVTDAQLSSTSHHAR